MTMSCEAEKNTISRAVAATAGSERAGSCSANAAMAAAVASWIAIIQPRRRPRNGSGKRSSSGAQNGFSR